MVVNFYVGQYIFSYLRVSCQSFCSVWTSDWYHNQLDYNSVFQVTHVLYISYDDEELNSNKDKITTNYCYLLSSFPPSWLTFSLPMVTSYNFEKVQ